MTVAGLMLAHQYAAKAFRDATFLDAWSPEALPRMVLATVGLVLAAVPVYAQLLARFGPRRVVPVGFVVSGLGHVVEWMLSSRNPWVAVAIYLHAAGFGTLLLSGFWSLVSERFDPRSAKASFGRIAAAGTLGGLAGGLMTVLFASAPNPDRTLLVLAALHLACAAGVVAVGRAPETFPVETPEPDAASGLFRFDVLRRSPHLRALAALVILTAAGAFLVDYLLKEQVSIRYGSDAEKLRFFAWFYTGIGLLTFVAQTSVSYTVRHAGIGRTIASLPAGFGGMATLALVFPTAFPFIVATRWVEAVLRGSLFRSAYELLFVPMDPVEKRRAKAFLDVTCDRLGDALGAGIVQVLLLAGVTAIAPGLLALAVAMSAAGLWVAMRLDRLYLGVVRTQLVRRVDPAPLVVGSETGWTIIDVAAIELTPAAAGSTGSTGSSGSTGVTAAAGSAGRADVRVLSRQDDDPRLRVLADLRSGDRTRVERALDHLTVPERIHVVQIVQLLAWDDLVGRARAVLERVAADHVGLLVDELLDDDNDFAIRRRIPRILGTVPSPRAVDGLVTGLDDARFEVRYQCSRALDRLLAKYSTLTAPPGPVLAAVERELSVPAPIWNGHRLIDDEDAGVPGADAVRAQRNLEHVFSMLTTVYPRESLQVALGGLRASNPALRSLAIEYLEGVLPPAIQVRLWALVDADTAEARPRTSPDAALEALRQSQEIKIIEKP
jgi:hypothetical protein